MAFEELEKNRMKAYISKVSIEYIQETIKKNNLKKVLEIGTCYGYSALKLSTVAQSVTTIEKDHESVEIAGKNFKKYKKDNIKIIEGMAIPILKQLQKKGEKFDLILIDAMKKEYKEYLILGMKLMDKGFIYADNTLSHKERLEDFFKYLNKSKLNWKELNIDKGLVEITKEHTNHALKCMV